MTYLSHFYTVLLHICTLQYCKLINQHLAPYACEHIVLCYAYHGISFHTRYAWHVTMVVCTLCHGRIMRRASHSEIGYASHHETPVSYPLTLLTRYAYVRAQRVAALQTCNALHIWQMRRASRFDICVSCAYARICARRGYHFTILRPENTWPAISGLVDGARGLWGLRVVRLVSGLWPPFRGCRAFPFIILLKPWLQRHGWNASSQWLQ